MVLPSLIVIAGCLWMRFITGGWLMFPGLIFYPLICFLHLCFHAAAADRERESIVFTSHGLFVIAFMVQWDQGDSYPWFTIARLFGASGVPGWWPDMQGSTIINIMVFAPVYITWLRLYRTFKQQAT